MSGFDDRKSAFENKYAHDQDMLFKLEARTCKLFGLWVAEQLGLSGDEASEYAAAVIGSNLEEIGFDDVKRKVRADIDAKGLSISDHMLDSKLQHYEEEARIQLESGK
ncbi:MAG: DUF1476 domain-containing protein [Micavibrio sp.]